MLSMDAKSLSEQNCPLAKRISLTLLLSYRPLLVRALWNPVGRRYDRPGDGRKHHCHAGPNRLFTRGGTTERSAVLISSLRSGLEVQFRFSKRGKTNTRSINWIKPKFWRPSPRAEVPSLTVGIRPPCCHACGTWLGCREWPSSARRIVRSTPLIHDRNKTGADQPIKEFRLRPLAGGYRNLCGCQKPTPTRQSGNRASPSPLSPLCWTGFVALTASL